MKINVLNQTVFLKRLVKRRKSAIITPDGEQAEDTGLAQVAFAGEKCEKVKTGDVVAIGAFGWANTIIDGVSYLVGNENNILATVEGYLEE